MWSIEECAEKLYHKLCEDLTELDKANKDKAILEIEGVMELIVAIKIINKYRNERAC